MSRQFIRHTLYGILTIFDRYLMAGIRARSLLYLCILDHRKVLRPGIFEIGQALEWGIVHCQKVLG
jgi:hypothetical protein